MKKKSIKLATTFLISALCLMLIGSGSAFAESSEGTSMPQRPPMEQNGANRQDIFKKALEQNIITQEQYEAIQKFMQEKAPEMKPPADNQAGSGTAPDRENPGNPPDRNKNMFSELVSEGLLTQAQADSISSLVSTQVPANGQSPQKPQGEASVIKVFINGVEKTFSPAPQIKNGSTLVPMRAFFETLGCSVEWDQTTKTVTGNKNGKTIKLGIGNKTAYVDGQQKSLAVEAQLINDSTFIPLRFVGEALGASVTWEDGKIIITAN